MPDGRKLGNKAPLGGDEACIVKLQRMRESIQKWPENLRMLTSMLEKTELPIERATQWRNFPDVDLKEVLSACDEAIAARTQLDALQSQKKKLGL